MSPAPKPVTWATTQPAAPSGYEYRKASGAPVKGAWKWELRKATAATVPASQ